MKLIDFAKTVPCNAHYVPLILFVPIVLLDLFRVEIPVYAIITNFRFKALLIVLLRALEYFMVTQRRISAQVVMADAFCVQEVLGRNVKPVTRLGI